MGLGPLFLWTIYNACIDQALIAACPYRKFVLVITYDGMSFIGGTIGFKLGERFRTHASRAGGLILCLIGLKVLLEHTGYL